jgi:hypothetical protein
MKVFGCELCRIKKQAMEDLFLGMTLTLVAEIAGAWAGIIIYKFYKERSKNDTENQEEN